MCVKISLVKFTDGFPVFWLLSCILMPDCFVILSVLPFWGRSHFAYVRSFWMRSHFECVLILNAFSFWVCSHFDFDLDLRSWLKNTVAVWLQRDTMCHVFEKNLFWRAHIHSLHYPQQMPWELLQSMYQKVDCFFTSYIGRLCLSYHAGQRPSYVFEYTDIPLRADLRHLVFLFEERGMRSSKARVGFWDTVKMRAHSKWERIQNENTLKMRTHSKRAHIRKMRTASEWQHTQNDKAVGYQNTRQKSKYGKPISKFY